ncbi:CU044_2847 family protein [Streptomyces sp. NPDC001941]|uniref:CU044_2847 family protein n=1 Tax=Streptomyces sp. NPDC001941 TaxID=3154659 RepID=UPI00331A19C3
MGELVRLEMPDGQLVWATVAEDTGPGDVGLGERVVEKLQGFHESLRAVATNVRDAVAPARPDEVSVEFGVELAVGRDGVMAALVGAGGSAAFTVTLTWSGAERPLPVGPPPAAPAP